MNWTNEQRQAIEYSGENILLAAAAGSGKTAVLVQRIIELICHEKDPININELLVLTFTDAAAREMREKISNAIEKALSENPENKHLQNQRLLMHSASISTIHSFCLMLIKNNIHMTDLPVNFSLVSEIENKMLIDTALDSVLERFYGNIDHDKSIRDLVMGYGGIKNDSALRETVLSLLSFSKSMASPSKWLNSTVREFLLVKKSNSLLGTVWQKWLTEKAEQLKCETIKLYQDILFECQSLEEGHSYIQFFDIEKASIARTFSHMDTRDYSSVRDGVAVFEFQRLPQGMRNPDEKTLALQNKIKALRQMAKDNMSDLWSLYRIPEEEMIKRIAETYPIIRTLKNIVLICDRNHTKLKREKNFLDFSDLEHEALELLVGKNGERTMTAKALREKYHEILIDEYQDTNHIQDAIFGALSRENRNIFMVGDLKQSIYTFRNAVPKLFADKYQRYEQSAGDGHLIRLFKNFRSRKAVVDVANFTFSTVMGLEVGDVDYTEEEYLIQGAEYPIGTDTVDFVPEFHFACTNGELAEGEEHLSKSEIEARIAAKRIREMIDSGFKVFDKQKKEMRPIKYSDVVVLMRNTKSAAPVFESVFEESGIPTYTEVGRSYLDAKEVQTVLSFLQIIDNPRQDIPLIAVMRSPMWGFSPEDLAKIRSKMKKGCFFDAVIHCASLGDEKTVDFLNELNILRKKSEHSGIEQLIWHIYYEYGYYAYAGAQSRGRERQANLKLLFQRAAEFEHTGLSGLFSFMAYIESLKSQGLDLAPSKILGDGDNVVKIMTIHKSKGLEFPVVILSDTARNFNIRDLSDNIIWNSEIGIGLDYVDTKLRVRYPSIPREIVAAKSKGELLSEEMRLLYVALTRAREKLIVTCTFKETKQGPTLPLYKESGQAKPCYIRSKMCFGDWILAAVLMHPDAKNLREYFGFEGMIDAKSQGFDIMTKLYKSQSEISVPTREKDMPIAFSEADSKDFDAQIKEKLEYTYPNEFLGKYPIKLSVSEAKCIKAEDEDYTPVISELRLAKIQPLERVTGAERGTVVHFLMQMAKPKEINSCEDVMALVKKMEAEQIITPSQAEAVDAQKIFEFFASPIGERLKNAVRVEKEFGFYTKVPLSEVYKTEQKGEILIQGMMDCFFSETDGTVVLLDFKTDRAKTKEDAERIAKRYTTQMKYYKKALAEILAKDVDECYLYFLDCGQLVKA